MLYYRACKPHNITPALSSTVHLPLMPLAHPQTFHLPLLQPITQHCSSLVPHLRGAKQREMTTARSQDEGRRVQLLSGTGDKESERWKYKRKRVRYHFTLERDILPETRKYYTQESIKGVLFQVSCGQINSLVDIHCLYRAPSQKVSFFFVIHHEMKS